MKPINYVKEDCLLIPEGKNIIIPHVCNCKGSWGRGFVLAISNKWKEPEDEYRRWCSDIQKFKLPDATFYDGDLPVTDLPLGVNQTVQVEPNVAVVNMIAQTLGGSGVPLRYSALTQCMIDVMRDIKGYSEPWEIRAPKFGSGLAGGDWDIIEAMIEEYWCANDIAVTICSL